MSAGGAALSRQLQIVLNSQREIKAQMGEMSQRLAAARAAKHQFGARTAEEMPGVKHPYIAVLSMSFPAEATDRQASYPVSATGPFIVSALAAAWAETSQAKWRPLASTIEADQASPDVNALDFEYEIGLGGSGWRLQNIAKPSALLFCNVDRPHYLPVPLYAEPNESIGVRCTTIVAPAAAGTLYFGLIGYKILDPGVYLKAQA